MRLSPELAAACLKLAGVPKPAAHSRPKYGNRRTSVGGVAFDSAKEARRYAVLKSDEAAGWVTGLRLQVRYPLTANGVVVAAYVADFVYLRGCVTFVEDVKGFRTAMYKLKRRMMKACHGITITES